MDDAAYPLPPRFEAPSLSAAGIRHAFFTREGGVSGGLYRSLNCGLGSGDDPAAVAENRRRAAAALDVPPGGLLTAYQVHGADVAVVDGPWAAGERPKVDGLVSRTPGVALGVLAADCAPVLFADPASGVIGACHAGWRGALNGVVEATVGAMERLGAARRRIRAAVGPCIAQASYEVGPEFRDVFLAADSANGRFFVPGPHGGRFMFDLPGYVLSRLERAEVGETGCVARDSCADAAQLFSYRRSCLRGEKDFGRGLSAIALAGDGPACRT